MVLVRLLLFLALAVVAVAAAMYLVTKDRRYLFFIRQTFIYSVLFFIGVLLFFAFERVVMTL